MTHRRAEEIIRTLLTDDDLIDIATTCSNRGLALNAEMHLRKRYPSKRKLKRATGDKENGK